MNGPEQNYKIHDKELLTIICCLGEWCAELEGLQHSNWFDIYTDHQVLEYFMMTKQLNPHQACWAEFLSQFYFSICYQPSKQNTLANTLSQPADQALLDKAHRVQVLLKPEVVDSEINISPIEPINIDPEPVHVLTKVCGEGR